MEPEHQPPERPPTLPGVFDEIGDLVAEVDGGRDQRGSEGIDQAAEGDEADQEDHRGGASVRHPTTLEEPRGGGEQQGEEESHHDIEEDFSEHPYTDQQAGVEIEETDHHQGAQHDGGQLDTPSIGTAGQPRTPGGPPLLGHTTSMAASRASMRSMDVAGPEEAPPAKRRWIPRNVKITLMVLILFFVGEYVLLPELASARKEFHQLGHLNFLWLIGGALFEIAALAAYAELTRPVLSPDAPHRFRIFRINMWALAISHVLPGGTVPGTAASYRLLTESYVPGSTAAFGLAAQGIGSAVVLNVIFWLSLLISIPLQGYNPLYGFAAILGVLLLAIFAAVIFFLTRGEKHASVFLKKVADRLPFVRAETVTSLVQKVADRMKILFTSSDLLMKAGGWAAANWLLDCASQWVFLLAFGAVVDPIDTLVAYGLANILAVIPLTPSGLGVVEITVIAVLKGFGVPGGVAAAGVLTWRLVNFWLPIPFGGASYLSLRFGHPRTATAKAIPT